MWSSAQTSLVVAIQAGDDAAIQDGLTRLANVDEFLPDGKTALIHAAEWDQAAAVDGLLQRGADPTLPDRLYSTTPFWASIQRRNRTIARLLLDAGRRAARAVPRVPLSEEDEGAVLGDDVEALMALLRRGVDPDSRLPLDRKTTLLAYYLWKRQAPATSILIQWGADTNALAQGAKWRWPPLHVAAQQGLEEIAWLLLLDGADANRIEQKYSALFLAAKLEAPAIAQMLLDAGAQVDLGLARETPLMTAADHGRTKTVEILIAHGADLDAASASGWTALHHAAKGGHLEVARVLLDAGADPLQRDGDGYNATDHATHQFDPVYAQIYRDWGIPDTYSLDPVDDAWEPSGDFDYFISYRHGQYAQVAQDLADHLCRAGLKPFIDRVELDLEPTRRMPRAIVKARLAKAVRRSRRLIFFETYLDSRRDPEDGGGFYSLKWQFFELLHAREALLVSIEQGWCARWIFGPGQRSAKSDTLFRFSSLANLVDKLESRDTPGSTW